AMLVSWRREPVICRPVSYVMEIQDRDRPGCDGKRVKEDGWNRGNIYGAYIHGIFDHPGIAETIVSSLAAKKGISMDEVKAGDYSAYRQQQYDKLADVLRSSLDMDAIYKMMGL
ncbi:MAG: cobyric acid synthase CobQ, partial [Enterocloster aldenensis]